MPWESIGECGFSATQADMITAIELGTCFLRNTLGEPPDGSELGVMWHEHELADYASVGIFSESPADVPWVYISKAKKLLSQFTDAVSWTELWANVEEARTAVNEDQEPEACE